MPTFTADTFAARLEDATWLADTGESLTGAAHRIGTSRAALEAWLRRWSPATLATLRAHEPRDPNQRPGLEAMRGKGWGVS